MTFQQIRNCYCFSYSAFKKFLTSVSYWIFQYYLLNFQRQRTTKILNCIPLLPSTIVLVYFARVMWCFFRSQLQQSAHKIESNKTLMAISSIFLSPIWHVLFLLLWFEEQNMQQIKKFLNILLFQLDSFSCRHHSELSNVFGFGQFRIWFVLLLRQKSSFFLWKTVKIN